MQLKEIRSDKEALKLSLSLLESAFPPEEYREPEAWLKLADEEPDFHNMQIIIESPDRPSMAGILTYWDLGGFIYIEHLATLPKIRGKGVGAKVLDLLAANTGMPMILEVEPPADEITARRIDFYRRNGFRLLDIDYMQPPYRKGHRPFPLRLMAKGDFPDSIPYEEAVRRIHNRVYPQPSANG